MTPLLFLALFLFAVSVGVLANEVRTIRALDRLWAQQRAQLLALNKKRPSEDEWDKFEWAPGAQWIITEPGYLEVLSARGLLHSGERARLAS